jgi:hypothetical protein
MFRRHSTSYTMPYASRYVAFVDILGFREIVNKSRDNAKLVDELAIVLKAIGERNAALEQSSGKISKRKVFLIPL